MLIFENLNMYKVVVSRNGRYLIDFRIESNCICTIVKTNLGLKTFLSPKLCYDNLLNKFDRSCYRIYSIAEFWQIASEF